MGEAKPRRGVRRRAERRRTMDAVWIGIASAFFLVTWGFALLAGTGLLVGALTFVPALALGPIVEHLQLHP